MLEEAKTKQTTDLFFDFFNETHEAWHQWEYYSCEERHNGHLWVVFIFRDEDEDDQLDVYCEYCGFDINSLVDDARWMLCGTLEDTVIECGEYNYKEDKTFKVNVDIHVESYTSMNSIGPEYDVWVNLSLRQ